MEYLKAIFTLNVAANDEQAAKDLDFLQAAQYRDELLKLQEQPRSKWESQRLGSKYARSDLES